MAASTSNKTEKESSSSGGDDELLPYVCVHCGSPSASLYRQLSVSLSSIQTTTCSKCGKIVDPYAEREGLLVAIDCILLREEAYRHVLYNVEELKQLPPIKCFQFLVAWSILETYLKWETLRIDGLTEGDDHNMGSPFHQDHFGYLISLGAGSLLGMLLRYIAIFGYLSLFAAAGIKNNNKDPSPSGQHLSEKVFLALLLPSSFSVVTIIVMIWENTKTVRLLGSVLIAYWQGIALSVISNDIYIPTVVGILVSASWHLALSTMWLQPYPCVGLEINGWDENNIITIPSICVT